MLALRTQQVLAFETGVPDVVDPLAGSYFVESLTDAIEADANELLSAIADLGGAVAAIEEGFQQREIESAAYDYARRVDAGETVVVGLNRFTVDGDPEPDVMQIDPTLESNQIAALSQRRQQRDESTLRRLLDAVTSAARGHDNVLYPMKDALLAGASIGEITEALLPVFGRYRPA